MDAIQETRRLSGEIDFTLFTDQECKIEEITCNGGTVKTAGVGLHHKPRVAVKGEIWREGETLRLIVEPDSVTAEVTVKVTRK